MKILLTILLWASMSYAQGFTQRGFLENRLTLYPQDAPTDGTNLVGETLFRYEGFYNSVGSLQIAGALDLRIDTHHQVNRNPEFAWWDREIRRPLVSIRRLSALWYSGGLSLEVGKQLIRWGKADLLNPTDRFAPRDYLAVVDNDFIGVTAARLIYEKGAHTLDLVFSPKLTPSRIPLEGQRWVVPQDLPDGLRLDERVVRFPGGPQMGIRWNRIGWVEFSASFYEGFNHVPSFDAVVDPQFMVDIERFYPRLRMAGGDIAVPLPWFTLKGESGYFTSSDDRADEYVLYVVQLERQSGEWFFVGGYAGEAVTREGARAGDFAPDRGLTETLLARAGYTLDTNRSLALESAIRRNGNGAWVQFEYSHAWGQHWRATGQVTLIRGDMNDFLGQYRRNSHGALLLRYSF